MTSINVRGIQYELLLNNWAMNEISNVCQDQDLGNLNEAMTGKDKIKNICYMIVAMVMGAEKAKKYDARIEGKEYELRLLSIDDLMTLPGGSLEKLAEAVKAAIEEGTETQVQLEPAKKKDESMS